MDNKEVSAEDVVFEYTGVGCRVATNITSVRFHEGLQKIGKGAFANCNSLESIKLPSTLVEIGSSAFFGCNNLREIIFNDGLQKIGGSAFYKCSSLESITLPSTVTEIDNHAFCGCSNLSGISFNNGLQKIGGCAFHSCTPESVTIPSTLVRIGNNAFSSCHNLREAELNGVPKYLKNDAFNYCHALEKFLFPTISYRLGNIIQTSHWEELEDKLNEVRGAVQWESDKLFVSRLATQNNWDDIRRDFGKIARLVSYYELREATSTFELAMWKYNLDQADATNTTNRAAYRMEVPGPVKDTMLQYLDHI